jgi:hypothetical protein
LATWVLGIGAAYGWDQWFREEQKAGKWLALGLAGLIIGIPFLALLLSGWAWDWLIHIGSYLAAHLIAGDAEHTQPLSVYLAQIPAKLKVMLFNLDPNQPRVYGPILFSCGLLLAVLTRKRWNIRSLKAILLLLVLFDLYAFRMPLGNAFYNPSEITAPMCPAPENRTLTLLYKTPSPLPAQYGEMAYPNMNLMFNRPNIVFDANPTPGRYADLWKNLGWFSWVYKDRDPLGFVQHMANLQLLGVDQIVSDIPLTLPKIFQIEQNHYPYSYTLAQVNAKACFRDLRDSADWTPKEPLPKIETWGETSLNLNANPNNTSYLLLQKTFLPGWKAWSNGQELKPILVNDVLMGIQLEKGHNILTLKFEPDGLRLGFFLLFAYLSVFCFFLFRVSLS